MTRITNFDTGESREADIITLPSADLHWCVAAWLAPDYGWSKVDGNGHGWQFVRLQEDGTYTYNGTMMGGYRDSLDDVREWARSCGLELIRQDEQ